MRVVSFLNILAIASALRPHSRQQTSIKKQTFTCYAHNKNYLGEANIAKTGDECQNWAKNYPNRVNQGIKNKILNQQKGNYLGNNLNHNFCRSLKPGKPPLCYLKNKKGYRFCNVDHCSKKDCYDSTDNGESYRGRFSTAKDGSECLFWNTRSPNIAQSVRNALPDGSNHNYCRNPAGRYSKNGGPWCYIKNSNRVTWRYCKMTTCSNKEPKCGVRCLSDNCKPQDPSKQHLSINKKNIINGQNASFAEFPWQVSIAGIQMEKNDENERILKGRTLCGASILRGCLQVVIFLIFSPEQGYLDSFWVENTSPKIPEEKTRR